MSHSTTIFDELWHAPDNSQGIVFVKQFAGGDGHVFNVGKFDGQVVWKDMTGRMESLQTPAGINSVTGMDPGFLLDGQPAEIYLYRVR